MGNRNEDEGQNDTDDLHRWPGGMSFTEAMFGTQTHNSLGFQQSYIQARGGPYSEQLSRNLTSGEFTLRYSQDSITTSSRALPEDRIVTNVRGGNWSIAEDEKLCHAWVRVSTDPITRDSQHKGTFWRRVFDDFVRQHGENEHVTRNQKACDQRFQHIRAECNKWSAALKKINDHPRSGQNAIDAERATHVYYRGQNNGKCFKLDHCWEILRNCAKYSETHGALRSSAIVHSLASDEFQCDRCNTPSQKYS